jgi:pimeloyl-ACP methyl ester carboxylesterase
MSLTDPTIDLDTLTLATGVRLEVASRGRGPAILFLHGYSDSWRSFEQILPRLPADVCALAVSQRGHGDSDRPPAGYRMTDLASDAAALLDVLGIDHATVVGHSMGSAVAQELALAHPERVSRLVLVGSATTLDLPVAHELEAAVRELRDPVPFEFAWEFQASTVHRPISTEFLRMAASESLKLPAHVWKELMIGMLAFRSRARLPELSVPTLIVWGDRDQFMNQAEQEALHSLIRGSQRLTYEDIGHAVHWEDPQRFTEDVLAFVGATTTRHAAIRH